jgi:hypothetical protein
MKKKWVLLLAAMVFAAGIGVFARPEGRPQYAWLVFGPEGKLRVRVTLEDKALTLEQVVEGKSTGRKDHFKNSSDCANLTFADPDGKTSYVLTSISDRVDKPGGPTQIMANIDIKGPIEYRQYCDLEMKEDLEKASLAHFHGPLTAGPRTISWKVPPKLALERGDKPTDLSVFIGTMNAEEGCWVVIRSHDGGDKPAFPKGIHPYVDVEFPPRIAGASSIKKRFPLDQFC